MSNGDSELVIKISCETESKILPTTTELKFPKYQQTVEAEISPSHKMNRSKDMSSIKEYNPRNFIKHSNQLKKKFM